jgi:DinB superfamily
MPDRDTTLRQLKQSSEDLVREAGLTPPEARLWRPKPGEWSVHECLAHLRDIETLVFLPRIRRMITEERPAMMNFDEVAYHREHYNAEEPADDLLAQYVTARNEIVELMTGASDWSRTGLHEVRGPITVGWQAEYALGHTWEHLSQIMRVRLAREISRKAA